MGTVRNARWRPDVNGFLRDYPPEAGTTNLYQCTPLNRFAHHFLVAAFGGRFAERSTSVLVKAPKPG